MKDGTTHLAYKPEHAVDLDTGAVGAAEIHPADEGDTTTLSGTPKAAAANLAKVDRTPSTTELVADKGYHSRAVLKDLDGGVRKTRIAEPQHTAFLRWRGDTEARNAVYANRNRLRSAVGQAEHAATGGDRRTIVRSQPGARRHAANLVARTRKRPQALPDPRHRPQPRHPDAPADRRRDPKEAAARGRAFLFVDHRDDGLAIVVLALCPPAYGSRTPAAFRSVGQAKTPSSLHRRKAPSSRGCPGR
jgi:hypothetical protein